jgi:hypothetical protein
MKGINLYLQAYTNPHQRRKRSEDGFGEFEDDDEYSSDIGDDDDNLPLDKRFLKGIQPYLAAYARQQPGTKRFMRLPYMKQLQQSADAGMNKDKRFLRGPQPYLQMYVLNRPSSKRFMRWRFNDDDEEEVSKRFMRIPGWKPRYTQDIDTTKRSEEDEEGVYDDDDNGDALADTDGDVSREETVEWLEEPAGRDKRFMRGLNPYLRQYFFAHPYDKRFMRGINPYLSSWRNYGAVQKRFLKGINPYLRLYSNGYDDKRFDGGADNDLDVSKRFLRGVNPYLSYYASSLDTRRTPDDTDVDEMMEDGDDDVTDDEDGTIGTEKRFIKGINHYFQRFSQSPTDKRFMKGVNPYLQHYASADKRFMKGVNGYLQRYNQAPVEKRFMKGINHYLQNYASSDKRFIKGWQPYVKNYDGQKDKRFIRGPAVDYYLGRNPHLRAVRTKRFARSVDYFLNKSKRFMKGINQYLRALSGAKRVAGLFQNDDATLPWYTSSFDVSPEAEMKGEYDGVSVDQLFTKTEESKSEKESEPGFSDGEPRNTKAKPSTESVSAPTQYFALANPDSLTTNTTTTSRRKRSTGMQYFALSSPDQKLAISQSTSADTHPVLVSREKKFLRGINSYLRAFAGTEPVLTKNAVVNELQDYAGDKLVSKLAQTAHDDEAKEELIKGKHSTDFLLRETDPRSSDTEKPEAGKRPDGKELYVPVFSGSDYNSLLRGNAYRPRRHV